jgi:hypothetical protein
MNDNLIDEDSTPYTFWRKIIFLIIFFSITPLSLFISIFSLIYLGNKEGQFSGYPYQKPKVLSASTEKLPSIASAVIEGDYRETVLSNFLTNYNSPLSSYSKLLIKVADEYGIDWKLLPAIAIKESGGCKAIPEGSYNCWGWGIHSKGTLMFDSYEEAIKTVALGLKTNYIDKGYDTVEKIMDKYAHHDSTTWADGVYFYINQIN